MTRPPEGLMPVLVVKFWITVSPLKARDEEINRSEVTSEARNHLASIDSSYLDLVESSKLLLFK